MSELTQDLLPYGLGLGFALAYTLLRPLGRRLVPLYAPRRRGAIVLALTWLAGAAAVGSAVPLGRRWPAVGVALVVAGPFAAGLALLAYRDARRSRRASAVDERPPEA